MFYLILISSILLSAVANVTTAVDIYSFGMCALEVRGAIPLLDWSCTNLQILPSESLPCSGCITAILHNSSNPSRLLRCASEASQIRLSTVVHREYAPILEKSLVKMCRAE